MEKTNFIWLACFTLLLVVSLLSAASLTVPSPARAERARSQLAVAPQELYAEMLKMAEKKDWEKLARSLKILEPLIQETGQVLQLNIEAELQNALATQDSKKVRKSLLKFMAAGIKSLLMQSNQERDVWKMKQALRQAFTEYLAIEFYFRQADFNICQLIQAQFRRCYSLTESESEKYSASCQRLVSLLDQILSKVEEKEKC